jgi:glutaredoxin-like protein NrdH
LKSEIYEKFHKILLKIGLKAKKQRGGEPMAVTVYTLPACVQCDSTKRMLQRNQIEYDEVDMSQDPVALEMVKTMGYTAAPVVVADDQHWSGFRMDKIQALSA